MEKKLINLINDILELENRSLIRDLNDYMSLRKDLGFDSIDLAVFTVKVEDEFGIDIFKKGNIDTIGEVLGCLKNE